MKIKWQVVGKRGQSMSQPEEEEKTKVFLSTSSDIAGNLAGAALQFAFAGFSGDIAGAIVAPMAARMFQSQARDFASRVLSQREQDRVVGVLDIAAESVREKMRLGHEPRSDNFFIGVPGTRSFADEITEAVLIAAQREHEERKARHLGLLLANLVFEKEIDRRQANFLVRLISDLSYVQLRLLAIYHRNDFEELRSENYSTVHSGDPNDSIDSDIAVLLFETDELWKRGLVDLNRAGENREDWVGAIPDPFHVVFSRMWTTGFAIILYDQAELDKIEYVELIEIVELMR
jgi:hypothetical protein